MIVAGFGCRTRVSADMVREAVEAALRQAGRILSEVMLLATIPARGSEPGLLAVASALGLRLVVPGEAELAAAAPRCLTWSGRSVSATGLPSAAEAAALAAAGAGARLLGPRMAWAGVTCALAQADAVAGLPS